MKLLVPAALLLMWAAAVCAQNVDPFSLGSVSVGGGGGGGGGGRRRLDLGNLFNRFGQRVVQSLGLPTSSQNNNRPTFPANNNNRPTFPTNNNNRPTFPTNNNNRPTFPTNNRPTFPNNNQQQQNTNNNRPGGSSSSCEGTGFSCGENNIRLSSIDVSSLPQTGGTDSSFQSELSQEVQNENREDEAIKNQAPSGGGGDSDGFGLQSYANGQFYCGAESKLIVPSSGRNYRNQVRAVVQYPGRFTQFFKLRICDDPNSTCGRYGERCTQEFNYQRVLVQDSYTYKLFWDWFKIPTCCSCKAPTRYG